MTTDEAIAAVAAAVCDVDGDTAQVLVDEVLRLRADVTRIRARTLVLHGYVQRLRDSKHRTCDCPERVLFFMENGPDDA